MLHGAATLDCNATQQAHSPTVSFILKQNTSDQFSCPKSGIGLFSLTHTHTHPPLRLSFASVCRQCYQTLCVRWRFCRMMSPLLLSAAVGTTEWNSFLNQRHKEVNSGTSLLFKPGNVWVQNYSNNFYVCKFNRMFNTIFGNFFKFLGHALIVKSRHVHFLHQTLQEPTAAPKTTAGVPISACPIPKVGSVSVGGASSLSMQLPVWGSLTAPQGRRPATMGVSVWAAASSAMAVWTVRTGRTSGTVSLEFLESPKCDKSKNCWC